VGGTNNGNVCDNGNDCPGGVCAGNPDSCNPPSPTPGGELGWWESFSVSDCAFVLEDHCCTDPVKIPSYRIIYDACPCGQIIFTKRNPNLPNEPPDSRGGPYCDEDNGWNKFGPLAAGTYYYPILSFLGGNFGQYQWHVKATPCPDAVCCYNRCSNSVAMGGACTTDANCPVGEDCVWDAAHAARTCEKICSADADCGAGSCDPGCGKMDVLECQDIGGAFLAPPNRGTAITECGTVCNTGSCCTGPGTCKDETQANPSILLTPDDCDGNPFTGRYVGGLRCLGGTCTGGTRPGSSCRANADCTGGGTCVGDAQQLAQVSPCPVCEIAAGDNCQIFDDSVSQTLDDLSLIAGARVAEDFVPIGSSITKICVWGEYTEPDPQGNALDCGNDVNDNFSIVVYNPTLTADKLPGSVHQATTSSGNNVSKAVQTPSAEFDLVQIEVWAYQLTLDTPIIGMTPDTLYWLEVRNDTEVPDPNNCSWSWMQTDAPYSDYRALGGEAGYGLGSGRAGDMAFCLDTNFSAPDAPIRACCDCNENCALKTKRACSNDRGSWDVTRTTCAGVCAPLPPTNDTCTNVVDIGFPETTGNVSLQWDNNCTSTDGPNPTPTELNPGGETFTTDIWYKYRVACDGTLTGSTCPTGPADGGGIDSQIGAYFNVLDRTNCECPHVDSDWVLSPSGTAFDENCTGILAGAGAFFQMDVLDGDCVLIRVGGFGGQGSETGQGILDIECIPSGGAMPPTVGDDTCFNGNTNLGTPCSSNAECTLPAVCGLKSRYLGITLPTEAVAAVNRKIKVTIATMPQFPARVGQMWWAGPEVVVANPPAAPKRGAQLVCTKPTGAKWAPGVIYLFGTAIVPNATYDVQMCDDNQVCSTPLRVGTSIWGNVVSPHNAANFADISAVVDKFRTLASAPITPRTDLVGTGNPGQPSTPNQTTNFADVSAAVDAFRTFPYGFTVPTCP